MRRPIILAVAGTAASLAALGAYRVVRPWYRTWGVEPGDATRLLPGDELIASPSGSETRGITIKAPATAIWPWLVQMGYDRAGWYSYDALDVPKPSADELVPEWQSIDVGSMMATHPGGGFEVVQLEPDRALVLFLDESLVDRRRRTAESELPESTPGRAMPPGLAVSSAILGTQPERFRATWAFVLEPIDVDTTRLVERARVEYPEMRLVSRLTAPFVGFGVFLMMRRQLIGLKQRAEALLARGGPPHHAELTAERAETELVTA